MLVTIAHYKYLFSACLAKQALEKAHILSVVYTGTAPKKSGLDGDYSLLITDNHLAQAQALLSAAHLL